MSEVDLYVEDVRIEEEDGVTCLEIVAKSFLPREKYVVHIPVDSAAYEKLLRVVARLQGGSRDSEASGGGYYVELDEEDI